MQRFPLDLDPKALRAQIFTAQYSAVYARLTAAHIDVLRLLVNFRRDLWYLRSHLILK